MINIQMKCLRKYVWKKYFLSGAKGLINGNFR